MGPGPAGNHRPLRRHHRLPGGIVTPLPRPALPLPALDGRTPLGFLAALGVLRLVTDHTGHPARLAWSPQDATAILHDAQPDIDTLVTGLTTIITKIPDDGVLPETSAAFPPP